MDSPLVTIIIPTHNSASTIEACLKSIQEQTYKYSEIIVVDNNSTDSTKELVKNYTTSVFNQGPERSAQRNFGAKNSKGIYLLFIDSDMELSPKVVEECVTKIQTDVSIKGIIIPEESFGVGFWAQCKKLERSFYVGVDWMEAGRFFSKSIFDKMKGYDEENTGTEDYDLPQRIEANHGRSAICRINESIFHNEQKISLLKTCKKKYYYAKKLNTYSSVEANKENFNKQSSIVERYKLFLSQPKKLLNNPLTGIGMLYMKTCEMGAGGLGYVIS